MPNASTQKGRSNVVELPGLELPGLGVAATAFTGSRIGGSRNEIWLCPAYGHGAEQLMLYVKLGLPTRAMLVEALCAQVAYCLGLDAPRPFIVTVNPKHVGRAAGPPALAFGAEDLAERSLAKPLRNVALLLDLLRSKKVADLACAFDEWIANDVRSPSDILVSPEERIYLIDHEAAIAPGLDPGQAVTNWLGGRLLEGLGDRERAAFLRQLRGRLAALQRVKLDAAPLAAQYSPQGVPLWNELREFLVQRLAHLDRILSERVVPEQRYLTEQAPADEPQQHGSHRATDV